MVEPVSVLSLAAVLVMSVVVSGQQTHPETAARPARPPATRPPTTAKPATPATAKPAPPAPAPAPPKPATDVRLRTSYTHGAQVSQNVTYLQGPRQRVEFPGVVSIDQCDLKRAVMLNASAKRYRTDALCRAPASQTASVSGRRSPRWPAAGMPQTPAQRRRHHRDDLAHRHARAAADVRARGASREDGDRQAGERATRATRRRSRWRWMPGTSICPEQSACMRPPAAAPPPPPPMRRVHGPRRDPHRRRREAWLPGEDHDDHDDR